MEEALVLVREFLDEHPDAAIRTLEQHQAAQVAAFLDTLPEHYTLLVLERALPAFGGQLCRVFGRERSIGLLLQLDVARMVAVLRYLPSTEIEDILNECPKSRRQASVVLLHYPLQCVGAWIAPNTALVSGDFTVSKVLAFLRDVTEDTFSKYIFVTNRQGVPEGRVSYLALLKARSDQKVSWLMEKPLELLSGNMLLAQANKLACWDEGDVMPVVGAQQQFIGVLRHADLRRGLYRIAPDAPGPQPGGDPLTGIFNIYGTSLLALFSTVSNAVESELKS